LFEFQPRGGQDASRSGGATVCPHGPGLARHNASSAFGYQQKPLWLSEHQHDGRPAYASEGTDLSTLTVTDSRPERQHRLRDDDDDDDGQFEASADSESTLSADGAASSGEEAISGGAPGWDGVISGVQSGVAERRHLIETDRTSLSSSDDWADCEYELIAAHRVSELFEQIDSLLYRQDSASSEIAQPPVAKTQEECSEWRSAFPHMRLRGRQLAPPREPGFAHRAAPPPSSDDATPRPAEEQELAEQTEIGAGLEELLAQEGCVEEAIAIDNEASTEEPQRPPPRRMRLLRLAVGPPGRLVHAAVPRAAPADRRFTQQQRTASGNDDDQDGEAADDDDTIGSEDYDDEPAGPLHRGLLHAAGFPGHRHTRLAAAAANANSAAVAAASDPQLAGDLAGLLSISSKTLQQRSEPAFAPAAAAPAATASIAGFGRRPLNRLAPVDRPKTPQQPRLTVGGSQQQAQLHHQQPQLPLHPHHHPQHAGLFAAFTRSGTLPPLHDRRGPQLLQQASQPHHPSLRAGGAASVRPGSSGGRPGAYSSLDWPTPPPGGHFNGVGRTSGKRANSGLHHRTAVWTSTAARWPPPRRTSWMRCTRPRLRCGPPTPCTWVRLPVLPADATQQAGRFNPQNSLCMQQVQPVRNSSIPFVLCFDPCRFC
uniref:DUF3719 domain-containing protein n=1 Tax=Macrostomum lignano TaxID=282301 RepID=A0A1I8FTG0_9PLAT